ncbi:Ankyrin-3 [Colletotrichum siamense]|nr:Ankyrin-3 [Colletotrichum siamense]
MGADPNWTKDGLSALQLVLKQETVWGRGMVHDAEVAMILLDAGAVLTEDDIRLAIKLSDWALIYRLLKKDHVGIWHREEYMLLLKAAIASGKQHLVTEVFKRFPNAYTAGALCASVFFEEDNFGIVRQLLENRPRQDDVTPIESLAIGIAAWRCREDLLDLLLARLRKPSPAALPIETFMRLQKDRRPSRGLEATYDLMSIDRADKRLFWEDRTTSLGSPLFMALRVMSENCLLRLLAHGFLPDRLTMSCAAQLDDPGHRRILRELTRYPMVFPGYETLEGPLTVSVKNERMDKVQVLLLYGNHSINESNHLVLYGRSPLQMAAEIGNLDLIHLLLNAGADVNSPAAQSYGATALQIAAIKGHLGVAKILVDLGANVNAPGATDEGGRTALEGAAEHGRIDTIQYLLSQGVETNAKGRISYLRVIRYAELEGHMAAAKLLKTWREWAADDDALWDKLQSLPKDECERFTEKDFEDQSDSNSESERHSLRKANAGGGMQHLVSDDAPAAEAHTHERSVTANPAGGIISELEDLEMMTSDAFAFWSEV